MTDDAPSIRTLAGQLAYLYDDNPDLRTASDEEIARHLNHTDRYARARERYPMHTDKEVAEKVSEFEDRITAAAVKEARGQIPK